MQDWIFPDFLQVLIPGFLVLAAECCHDPTLIMDRSGYSSWLKSHSPVDMLCFIERGMLVSDTFPTISSRHTCFSGNRSQVQESLWPVQDPLADSEIVVAPAAAFGFAKVIGRNGAGEDTSCHAPARPGEQHKQPRFPSFLDSPCFHSSWSLTCYWIIKLLHS